MKLDAILAKNPTTAEDADLGVVSHVPFGHDAGASGLVIPHATTHAGSQSIKPFAGSDTLGYVNRMLVGEGFETFDKMSNEKVIAHYGKCSAEGHQLAMILEPGVLDGVRVKIDRKRALAAVSGADGCQGADNKSPTLSVRGVPPAATPPDLNLTRIGGWLYSKSLSRMPGWQFYIWTSARRGCACFKEAIDAIPGFPTIAYMLSTSFWSRTPRILYGTYTTELG